MGPSVDPVPSYSWLFLGKTRGIGGQAPAGASLVVTPDLVIREAMHHLGVLTHIVDLDPLFGLILILGNEEGRLDDLVGRQTNRLELE